MTDQGKNKLHLPPDPEIGDAPQSGIPGQLPELPLDRGGPAVALDPLTSPAPLSPEQAAGHVEACSEPAATPGEPGFVERRKVSPPPSEEATEIKPRPERPSSRSWGEWLSRVTLIVFVGALVGFTGGVVLAILILSGELSMKTGLIKDLIDWIRALR